MQRRPRSGSHKKFEITGKLIVVEGIDGSGKSTQLHLLDRWLRSMGLPVFTTEWNSSQLVRDITSRGKKKGLLTPTTFSLLHATDFTDRYERNMLPLLRGGYIVLADRYVYTAYARDVVRGCNPGWVRKVYNFAVKPDLRFYFRVPIDVAMKRILGNRPKLKFYEAGMDLNLSHDPDTSADVVAALARQADDTGEDIRHLLRDALGAEASPPTMNAVFNAIRGTALSRQISDAVPGHWAAPRTSTADREELSVLFAGLAAAARLDPGVRGDGCS